MSVTRDYPPRLMPAPQTAHPVDQFDDDHLAAMCQPLRISIAWPSWPQAEQRIRGASSIVTPAIHSGPSARSKIVSWWPQRHSMSRKGPGIRSVMPIR